MFLKYLDLKHNRCKDIRFVSLSFSYSLPTELREPPGPKHESQRVRRQGQESVLRLSANILRDYSSRAGWSQASQMIHFGRRERKCRSRPTREKRGTIPVHSVRSRVWPQVQTIAPPQLDGNLQTHLRPHRQEQSYRHGIRGRVPTPAKVREHVHGVHLWVQANLRGPGWSEAEREDPDSHQTEVGERYHHSDASATGWQEE